MLKFLLTSEVIERCNGPITLAALHDGCHDAHNTSKLLRTGLRHTAAVAAAAAAGHPASWWCHLSGFRSLPQHSNTAALLHETM
jgi:hypothetical protein